MRRRDVVCNNRKVEITDGTFDVDHQSPAFVANRFERYAELRAACPVARNPNHGGFWMVTDYESVSQVARDNETFAHRYELEAADGIAYQGICGVPRPAGTPRQGVSEYDGRHHGDLRRALNPHVSPSAVEALRPRMEALCTEFIDGFIEAGSCDLVRDYATPVPAILTLEMMGMPSDNWKHYADFFHASSSYGRDSEEFIAAMGRWQDMWDEIAGYAAYRRRNPGDDVTSTLVSCEVDGRALTDDEVTGAMWNLVAGGIDTTTALVSWGLHHLGTTPADRDRLIADPSRIPLAVEEFLRFYSPNESLTRTATRDVELGGRQITRGDVVFISWVSANHDEAEFDRADAIDIGRFPNRHIAFGLGGHRCLGSHLARVESEVMIAHVLGRLPDYMIDEARFRPYPGNLLLTGVVTMPVTFMAKPVAEG